VAAGNTATVAATRIVMVKKIMADGSPCAKCDEIEQRLRRDGWAARIERTVIADERHADSEGMQLARRHGISLAPFFIVSGDGGEHVYTSYLKLVREIFAAPTSAREETAELLQRNPDLDYL